MASISSPFGSVDFTDLPKEDHFLAREGTALSFRTYPVAGGKTKGSVVLVHGSSASSRSMHVLAKAFVNAGYTTYALDIRGHGASGSKGYIAYVGQLEDDLEDFSRSVSPARPATLAGFSAGGGFVLRFAGSARQKLFSNYLLLSPFISQDAPTYRQNAGGWLRVGMPRYIAIGLLDSIGVHVFDELPVMKFALNEGAKTRLTSQYSYALAQNFRPQPDYRANITAIGQPLRLVAGQDDEVFYAAHYAEVFKSAGKAVPVTLVSGVGHVQLTIEQAGVQAAVSAVRTMNEPRV